MQPYNADSRTKHRTVNRDDIHHRTQDAGNRQRKAAAKAARKAARQDRTKEIALSLEE